MVVVRMIKTESRGLERARQVVKRRRSEAARWWEEIVERVDEEFGGRKVASELEVAALAFNRFRRR